MTELDQPLLERAVEVLLAEAEQLALALEPLLVEEPAEGQVPDDDKVQAMSDTVPVGFAVGL